jgi:hypothetical protein
LPQHANPLVRRSERSNERRSSKLGKEGLCLLLLLLVEWVLDALVGWVWAGAGRH